MPTWHASITFTCISEFSDDAAFDLMDALLDHGVSMTTARDHLSGTITTTLEADTALAATNKAIMLLQSFAPSTIGEVTIAGIEVLTDSDLDIELARPTFPEVVGFAEIAEMGGFDRSRSRQLAKSSAFPAPVIKTSQGPLYSKHAIARYLENRNTRPGRPAKASK